MYEWFTFISALCFATMSHIYDPRWPATASAIDIITNKAQFDVAGLDLNPVSITDKVVANATMLVPFLHLVDPSFEHPEPPATRTPPAPPLYNYYSLFLLFGVIVLVSTLLGVASLLAEKAVPRFMGAFDELCNEVFPGFVTDGPEMYTLSCEKLLKLIEGLESFRKLATQYASQRDEARSAIMTKDAQLEQLRRELQARTHERDEALQDNSTKTSQLSEMEENPAKCIQQRDEALAAHRNPNESVRSDICEMGSHTASEPTKLETRDMGTQYEPPEKKKRKRRHRRRKPKDGSTRPDQQSEEGGDDDENDEEGIDGEAGPSGQPTAT